MTRLGDVEVLDGGWTSDGPVIVLDAATAKRAIELGELKELVAQGLAALDLSGKQVVFLSEEKP